MKDLPVPVRVETSGRAQDSKADDPMTIAWRYQNMRQVQSVPGSSNSVTQLGHNFDLTQTVSPEDIERCDHTLWSGPSDNENRIG